MPFSEYDLKQKFNRVQKYDIIINKKTACNTLYKELSNNLLLLSKQI
ncbi:MAG: hypothetical protein PWQ06_1819 [Anaerophaga sp.]|nr:hypothetical protein [Anaerophaga sp.]